MNQLRKENQGEKKEMNEKILAYLLIHLQKEKIVDISNILTIGILHLKFYTMKLINNYAY